MQKIAYPLFFTGALFDYLKIEEYKRNAAQCKIEYLLLKKDDILALTGAKILREGFFWEVLYYVEMQIKSGSLLCVFDEREKCCRSYYFIKMPF